MNLTWFDLGNFLFKKRSALLKSTVLEHARQTLVRFESQPKPPRKTPGAAMLCRSSLRVNSLNISYTSTRAFFVLNLVNECKYSVQIVSQ